MRPIVSVFAMRTVACSLLVLLAACAARPADSTSTASESDYTTNVLASNAYALDVGPSGELRITMGDTKVAVLDPNTDAIAPSPTPNPLIPGYPHAEMIGWDAAYFYFYAQISTDFYGGRRIYRVALDPGFPASTPEAIGDVGNGENAPDPLATLVAPDAIYWTTLPNTCTVAAPDTCWQMSLGRVSAGAPAQRVTPKLADGTYVGLAGLAFYQGDLYAANSKGIYKLAGGDLAKPLEQLCAYPTTFPTKLSNSTILAGTSRSTFAVSDKGFIVPLQSADYQSALGLVRWDCSTDMLTPFGPAAQGMVRTFGVTQIADILVRGNDVFWLDRQPYSPADRASEDFYALKKTTF